MQKADELRLIAEIHRAVHALGIRIADKCDITQAEALVLALLHPVGIAPLEEVQTAFMHRRSTLTNVLVRLEERGLVSRRVAPEDRRRFEIQLTAPGKRLASEVAGLFRRIVAESGLTDAQAANTTAALAKIVAAASE